MKKASTKAAINGARSAEIEGKPEASRGRKLAARHWTDDFDCSVDGFDSSDELRALDEFERRHGPLEACASAS